MNLFLKGHEATCFYNQIYCMDCMELLAEIPDGAVSLILTDRPMVFPIKIILPSIPILC